MGSPITAPASGQQVRLPQETPQPSPPPAISWPTKLHAISGPCNLQRSEEETTAATQRQTRRQRHNLHLLEEESTPEPKISPNPDG